MALNPFARSIQGVEHATRIVNAASRDGVSLRGKLVVVFTGPLLQATAEESAGRVAAVVESILRDSESDEVLGAEAGVIQRALTRIPSDVIPVLRDLELAALHVVGQFATSGVRARTSEPALATLPSPGISTDPATTARAAPSTAASGSAVAPLVETAVDQLVGCLRSIPELAALGPDAALALRREIEIVTVFFLFDELIGLGVPQRAAIALVEAVGEEAFPGESPTPRIGAYLHPSEPSVLLELLGRLGHATGEDLEPRVDRVDLLLAAHRSELHVAAAFLKRLAVAG